MPTDYETDLRSEYIEAVCPRCGAKHKLRAFYNGPMPPKYFCKLCKVVADKTETAQIKEHTYVYGQLL